MEEKAICVDCGTIYPVIDVICPACGSSEREEV